jgi:ABC-2 type transport system permease protein
MNRLWSMLRYTFLSFRGQILGWGLGVACLGLIIVPFYGVFSERQADFMKMLEVYPPEFLAFFGGDANKLLTPEGFLGMYGFAMLPVIVPIFAVIAGSGLFASDEERGRLDLILSHPVGRTAFFFGRLLAFVGASIAILFIAWLGFCLPMIGSPLEISWSRLALPFISLLAQTLIYGTLALLLSTLLPSRSLAATLSGLVMVVSYFLSSMAFLDSRLETIARILPYSYYQGSDAMQSFNLIWLLSLLGASAVMALLAWWRFQRRDIRLSGEGTFGLPSFPLLRRRAAG